MQVASRPESDPHSPSGLVLTGSAGGGFGVPTDDSPELDGVEFCRARSGRTQIDGVRPDLVAF